MTGMQRVKRSDTISLAALADEVLCDLAPIADQKQIKLSNLKQTVSSLEAIFFSTVLFLILLKMQSSTIILMEVCTLI